LKREEGVSHEDIMEIIWATSRDNSRTPMQWSDDYEAGFTTGTPWMKVNPNYKDINVKKQLEDERSILSFYKKMIQLKKNNDVFTYGKYELLLEEDPQIYVYTRESENDKVIVLSNLTGEAATFALDEIELKHEQLLLANYEIDFHDNINGFTIKPFETRVYRLT
jgi:alpha-glucosidase